MVVTGAKTEEASKTAARKYARMIQKLGNPVSFTNFSIQNIVGSVDVKFAIDLEEIHNKHSNYCSYEPEIFPGLVYRMLEPKIVILIFVSGKLVLTGAKKKLDIETAFQKIYPLLEESKKKAIEQQN